MKREKAVGAANPSFTELAKLRGSVARGDLLTPDGQISVPAILLRDQCQCHLCINPSSGQREFSFTDIPVNIKANVLPRTGDEDFKVSWEDDIPGFSREHISSFSPAAISALIPSKAPFVTRSLWAAEHIAARVTTTSYQDYMNNDSALAETLLALERDGLVFVNEVPPEAESVSNVAQRIGPVRNSFYGSTWDVRSIIDSKNVAYTDKYLGFHMDLLYYHHPPDYQLLHCVHNSCSGGESRFVDTLKALDVLISENPEHYELLRTKMIGYHYRKDGQVYSHTHQLITGFDSSDRTIDGALNPKKLAGITRVLWSPPFMQQMSLHTTDGSLRKFLCAAKAFADILERPEMVYEMKLEEGTCVIFHNVRVAHARNAFDIKTGQRWLRGAYLDREALKSKINTLQPLV